MSLTGKYYSNRFNAWFSDSYTSIISIEIKKNTIPYTRLDESEEIKIRSNHILLIETNTWVDKKSKDEGKAPVEFHTYYIPCEYDTNTDIFQYCYTWLKNNVEELKNCIDT